MKNRIAEFRQKIGLSQTQLAKEAKITRPYLSDIERGIKSPTVDVAKRLCQVLGTNFEILFCCHDVNDSEQIKLI
ncbi:transcriptional regulator [Moorella sp. E308F]|jgi:putative transcriptional regulator|uniref:helix-turn-helix transcriptional regulator n=1 Tax=Moorella sp. E308F TaxID=2572682 RepID=UPI0010FFAF76|nr:helix-turn-helix transcriptional regulator [Moorella sp. E308F]GEA14780.1 transcriptional regulator [Moorella sp. E308F]